MAMKLNFITLMICITVLPSVNGCGQIQPGRERTINYKLSGFKLPAAMVYYQDSMAKTKVPTISTTEGEVQAFVRRLIRQPVEDVLYEQGRSALLPDNVISSILQQLEVQITYEPLKCEHVVTKPNTQANGAMQNLLNCIIVDETVTNTCKDANAGAPMCMMNMMFKNFEPTDSKYLPISGTLKTSNVIMANWSSQMWESVLNRVLRRISSGPNGSYFYGASVRFS